VSAPEGSPRRAATRRCAFGGFREPLSASLSGGRTAAVVGARASREPAALLLDEPFSALDTHLRARLNASSAKHETYQDQRSREPQSRRGLPAYAGNSSARRGEWAARSGRKNFPPPATLEVAVHRYCKNFSALTARWWTNRSARLGLHPPRKARVRQSRRARRDSRAPCSRARGRTSPENHANTFLRLAAMTETPFRVTLDLRIGGPPVGVKAEAGAPQVPPIFTSRRKSSNRNGKPFRNLHNLADRLAPDRLFLLPD